MNFLKKKKSHMNSVNYTSVELSLITRPTTKDMHLGATGCNIRKFGFIYRLKMQQFQRIKHKWLIIY